MHTMQVWLLVHATVAKDLQTFLPMMSKNLIVLFDYRQTCMYARLNVTVIEIAFEVHHIFNTGALRQFGGKRVYLYS